MRQFLFSIIIYQLANLLTKYLKILKEAENYKTFFLEQ